METDPIDVAGITASFWSFMHSELERDKKRRRDLSNEFGGEFGILGEIVASAAAMKRYLTECEVQLQKSVSWGEELPHPYDAWDSIANSLWVGLGSLKVEDIVFGTLDALVAREGDPAVK